MSVTLVLGGARSGKSRQAEALVTACLPPWHYLATAEALDDEMRERITAHRARRREGWLTLETPIELADALAGLADGGAPVLVDCLTLWLTNLTFGEHDVAAHADALDRVLAAARCPVVLVANEVGLGIVPESALGRRFRDEAGSLNQRVAARADRVLFMAAGLALPLK